MINEQQHIATIINGCKGDDRKAQEQLYRSFYRVMVTLCLRYTKNEADAIEVLNIGFLKVFKTIHRYDAAQASLYTWIRTIVINSCLDFIKRKEKDLPANEIDKAEEIAIPADIITKMKGEEILQLVRQLPPATGAVFNLYVLDGYNHKEIGQMLQISEGTSKWHLSEARKALQKWIQNEQMQS